MKPAAQLVLGDTKTIHMLPRWVTSASSQDTDTVAFTSGAALAMLDVVLRDPGGTLPGALLRDRMALNAAVACLKLENRRETMSDIRDAICLARAGDALGPAGDMFVGWRRLARINLTASGWKGRLAKSLPSPVAEAMPEFGSFVGSPIGQAAQVLEVVLRQFPRQEAAALTLADVALARALGWDRVMPLLAVHLTRKDMGQRLYVCVNLAGLRLRGLYHRYLRRQDRWMACFEFAQNGFCARCFRTGVA